MKTSTVFKVIAVALALWVALLAVGATIADSSTKPSPGATKAFTSLAQSIAKTVGGKSRVVSATCSGPVKGKVIYTCVLRAVNNIGKPTCQTYYVAFRPGFVALPWNVPWSCGAKPGPLPPIPPKRLYIPVQAAKGPAS